MLYHVSRLIMYLRAIFFRTWIVALSGQCPLPAPRALDFGQYPDVI